MAASDKLLGDLHAAVATVLRAQLDVDEPSAAMIGAAITFLKNNNITADVSGNDELRALQDSLAKKRAAGRLGVKELQAAADDFAAFSAIGLPQ